jgi:hypothetical protein
MHLGGVGAVNEAEFALEAVVSDSVLLFWSQATRIMIFMSVDVTKQGRKRWTQGDTRTTALTHIEDTSEFVTNICLIEVLGVFGVVGNSHCFF